MKKVFFFLISILFLACNSNEKYEGVWYNTLYDDAPQVIKILEDSIAFNYPYFNYKHNYTLEIHNNELKFNGYKIRTNLKKDTLIINGTNTYIKNIHNFYEEFATKNKPEIELPELNSENFSMTNLFENNQEYSTIYYGKRHDNKEYSLLLNDKYSEITDLIHFYSGHRRIREELLSFPITISFFDKNTKTTDVEKVLFELKKANQLKIQFINSINIKANDSIGLHYEYKTLQKIMMPITENNSYYSKLTDKLLPPPAPKFLLKQKTTTSLFTLKKNIVYYQNKKINEDNLKALVIKAIKKGHIIISLYDLESTYDSFLKLNAIIGSVYEELRNKLALSRYNKPYDNLENKQRNEIKIEIKLNHIWDYSIPHFNQLIENEGSFLGLKLETIE